MALRLLLLTPPWKRCCWEHAPRKTWHVLTLTVHERRGSVAKNRRDFLLLFCSRVRRVARGHGDYSSLKSLFFSKSAVGWGMKLLKSGVSKHMHGAHQPVLRSIRRLRSDARNLTS